MFARKEEAKLGRTLLDRLGVAPNGKFACLTYHIIGAGDGQYTLGERRLRDQLAFLCGEGYVVEGFDELEVRLRSGGRFPERYVVLTVDDGHESSMRAAELFESCGCRATFFITSDRALKRRATFTSRKSASCGKDTSRLALMEPPIESSLSSPRVLASRS